MIDEIKEASAKAKKLVRYIPKRNGRKWVTDVTNTERNGGLYDQEEFRKAVEMMEAAAHYFRNPRLFHICFTGADLRIYKLVMKRLGRGLEAEGVDYCYKAALEVDSKKGEHFHVMLVLGTHEQTYRFITHKDETYKIENESLLRKVVRHTWRDCADLAYSVNRPISQDGLPFIQFNQSNMELFNEAVNWVSYIYKANTKPEGRRVFFSSHMPKPRQ